MNTWGSSAGGQLFKLTSMKIAICYYRLDTGQSNPILLVHEPIRFHTQKC